MRGKPAAARIPCRQCPLLNCKGLRPLTSEQLAFMEQFKQGELSVSKGTQVMVQGSLSPHLFTVLEGVLLRFKTLEDGRRQVVNFAFPGDFLGLQGVMIDPLTHSVEALTEVRLCIFSRERVGELFKEQPDLGFDITWLSAKEEGALEEHLTALGRRTALERLTYLAVFLFMRGRETGTTVGDRLKLKITQSQIADTLGLSLVHANRTLQRLRRTNIASWSAEEIRIPDLEAAIASAKYEVISRQPLPFI